MATRSQRLTLDVGPDDAWDICLRALLTLGWEVEEDGGQLVGRENAGALCCVVWPVAVGVELSSDATRKTTVELDFSIAGFGPIQNRQLRDRMRAVAIAILRAMEGAEARAPS